MPRALEAAFEQEANVLIFDGQEARHHFNHSHFGSHCMIEIGEFASDRSRADHRQSLWLSRQVHRLTGGNDRLSIECDTR